MKRLLYFTACLCIVLVALTACSGKTSKADTDLIGKWEQNVNESLTACSGKTSKADTDLIGKWEQIVNESGVEAVTIYDFMSDGKVEQTIQMSSKYPAMEIVGNGTSDYRYEDGVISFTFSASNFSFSKFEMEGVTDELVELAMEQVKSSMVNMEQQLQNVRIKGNKLTATFNGQDIELKRL